MKSSKKKIPSQAEENTFYDTIKTDLGTLILFYNREPADDGVYLSEITILPSGGELSAALSGHARRRAIPDRIRQQFLEYFKGHRKEFDIPYRLSGGDFDRRVWQVLKEIPYGQTRTYKWIASRIGSPKGVRAVGQALGRNPLPILIPCHRVIQSDGNLGGYSSGVDIKRRLLDLEYYNLQL